jgi:hypothetical protein
MRAARAGRTRYRRRELRRDSSLAVFALLDYELPTPDDATPLRREELESSRVRVREIRKNLYPGREG